MFEFDEALSREPAGEGRWTVSIPDGWDFAGFPNGGLLMALLASALGPATGHPDPVTMTVHYTAPAMPGPAEIEAEAVRAGRRLGTARGRLSQQGKVVASALGTFGDLAAREEGIVYETGLPVLPPVSECVSRDRDGLASPAIFDRVEIRFHPDHLGFATGAKDGMADLAGWMRFRDGRPLDPLAMLLFTDAHPPSVFNAPDAGVGWVPTIELTVHLHRRPQPGWIAGWFSTRHISGGFLEEDGVLWDESGGLIAVARQIAMVPRSSVEAAAVAVPD